jgi:hypothetical protein
MDSVDAGGEPAGPYLDADNRDGGGRPVRGHGHHMVQESVGFHPESGHVYTVRLLRAAGEERGHRRLQLLRIHVHPRLPAYQTIHEGKSLPYYFVVVVIVVIIITSIDIIIVVIIVVIIIIIVTSIVISIVIILLLSRLLILLLLLLFLCSYCY